MKDLCAPFRKVFRHKQTSSPPVSTSPSTPLTSDSLLRLISGRIQEMIIITDAEGKIAYHNGGITTILGYSLEEVIQENVIEAGFTIHPDDMDRGYDRMVNGMRKRTSVMAEYRVRHKQGHYIWLETSLTHELDGQGQLLYHIFVSRDVTERKEAEDALSKERHLLRSLIDAMPFHIYVRDRERRFLVNNQYNIRAFGMATQEDMLGKTDDDFQPNLLGQLNVAADERLLATGEPILNRLEYSVSAEREPIWGLANKAPLLDNHGTVIGLVGSTVDVTNSINAREALLESRLKEQALQETLDKEREVAELKKLFTSMLSHEFRTPLTTVMTSLDMLDRYDERMSAEQRRDRLDQVREQINALTKMLNDMLVVVQMQDNVVRFEPVPTDVRAHLERVVGHMRKTIGSRHTIELTTPDEMPLFTLDPRIFRYLMFNLLTNAIKYSAAGTLINVCLEMLADGGIRISVQDRGIGIPAADQRQLFKAFQRGANVGSVGGSGLGLKLVKECVDIHRGSIQVESVENGGTTITVMLPKAATEYPSPQPP